MEFDRHIARAVNLENARWHVAIEAHFGIRVVIHQQNVELPATAHDCLEVLARRDGCRRIVGIVQVQNLRAPQHINRNLIEIYEEVVVGSECVQIRRTAAEQRTAIVGVVAGIGDDCHIALVHVAECEMREPFFAAEERDDLGERIELHAEAELHPAAHRFAIGGVAEPESIPIHGWNFRCRCERVHGRSRRREISIAGAEVNHIDATGDQLALPDRNQRQRILGQRVEAM